MTEDQLQAACWMWAWNKYPQTRRMLWAVPNGGDRDIVTAAKLMATGVLPGVHDLHLLWENQFYTFELKVGSNRLTVDRMVITPSGREKLIYGQKEWGAKMIEQGGRWFEIRELERFKEIFNGIIEAKI